MNDSLGHLFTEMLNILNFTKSSLIVYVSALLVTTKFGFPLITLTSNTNFKVRLSRLLRLDNSLEGFI